MNRKWLKFGCLLMTVAMSASVFGCRKKTDMKADELACGIPYAMIPGFVEHLRKYGEGVMQKAKRD